jgi:hypothetical protein
MRNEQTVKYFAEDNTPFGEDREACLKYEALCKSYKGFISKGLVQFWHHSGKFLNPELIDFVYTDKTCYLDWLKSRLSTCGYVSVLLDPQSPDWDAVWEFIVEYLRMDRSSSQQLVKHYVAGDLLVFEAYDCCFHNATQANREYSRVVARLMEEVHQAS